MQYPDGLFDYFGIFSSFFLIFPFFYSKNKNLKNYFIISLQNIYSHKIDSLTKENIKEHKLGSNDNIEIIDKKIIPFGVEIDSWLKEQFQFKYIPQFLSISSLMMFFGIQIYVYCLIYIEKYPVVSEYVKSYGFHYIPTYIVFIIGLLFSLIFLSLKFKNIRALIKKIKEKLPTGHDKNTAKVRAFIMFVMFAMWCVLVYFSLSLSKEFPYISIFIGLIIFYLSVLLVFAWHWYYIVSTLSSMNENIINNKKEKTNHQKETSPQS